jgi:hypothetical protein
VLADADVVVAPPGVRGLEEPDRLRLRVPRGGLGQAPGAAGCQVLEVQQGAEELVIGIAVGLALLGLATAFLLWRAVRAQDEPGSPEARMARMDACLTEVRDLCRSWTGSAEGLALTVERKIDEARGKKRP